MLAHRRGAHRITLVIAVVVAASPALAFRQRGGDIRVELTRDYLVAVRGQMGDRGGLTVVIDTGSFPTLVDARIARPYLTGGKAPVDSLTGTSELERAVLPRLAIGEFSAVDVPALVTDLSRLEPAFGVRVDVVLGVDILRGTCFSIDYVRRSLTFTCRGGWRASTPLDPRSYLAVADVTIDGTRLRLRVDTGSPAVVLYDDAIPDGWRTKVEADVTGSDFSGLVRLRRMIAGIIEVGAVTWHQHPVYLLPADLSRQSYQGVLGIRSLKITAVQFDLQRMTLSWNH